MNKKHLLALLCFICAAVAAFADPPFRNHRYDTYKVEPINEQSIVFVGNSITDMHLWSEAFGNDPRVVNRGNSGGLSSEILANVKSYCAGHPAKIFLMIGTNDNPSASTASTIVGNIEKTIKAIQAESPSTEIYIESILPSSYNRTNANIAACNKVLKEMVANYEGVTYIDLFTKLEGKCDSNSAGYSYDALHLTAAGYQIWLAEIEKYMGGLKSVYPTNTLSLQQAKGNGGSHGMRTTYFSMMPLTSNDVLFFGDEMVKNGEWAELLRNPNIKNRGTGWGYEGQNSVMNVVSNNVDATFATVSGVTKQEPKQVLLYTGTGEVNGSTAISTIFTNYKAIITKIRKAAPNAKISLVSLIPTRTYNNNARVKQFNEKLQDYAADTENVEYIDIFSTLATAADQPKDEYFPVTSDNYIYGDGYIAIANVLNRYIDGCTPITAKEAAANRDLIKGVEPKLVPVATILDKEVTDAPYVLTDEEAAPFLAFNGKGSVVIDYQLPTAVSGMLTLVGASDKNATNHTFSIVARDNGSTGVCYYGLNNGLEGWYTSSNAGLGSGSHKVVIVFDPEFGYKYYADGSYLRDVIISGLGEYGFAHFGNISANTVSLGGLVTSAGTSLGGKLNIKSVRLYDVVLTDEQIRNLSYDFSEGGEELGPENISYVIDAENGFLQRNDGTVNSNWNTYWYSNQEPVLELNAGVNNMTWADNNVQIETGSANGSTYTFRAPTGYLIKDVKFTAVAKTAGKTVTLTFDGDAYTTSATGQTFEKTDINKATFAFGLSGTNGNSTLLKDATVTVIRKDLVEVPDNPNAEPELFTVFSNKGAIPYRIPAIATAQNGNLICVADYRTSKQDIGNGEIDLHVRISKDNGKTWEPVMKPAVMDGDANFTKGYQLGAFGDPCIVADRESGRVLVMSCSGYKGYFAGSRDWHQGLARWYSDDNGETWNQAPDIIDEQFIYGPMDESKYGPIVGMFIGSGKIHQSRYVKVGQYYRLYCAFSSHMSGTNNSQNYVIYSDDFGMTWNFLGGVNNPAVVTSGDEPKCEELPNGNLLFSGRIMSQGGRHYNIFQFTDREKAEGKWMGVAVSNSGNSGILGNNATNGEILLVPVVNNIDGARHYLALQSVPWGPGRANVGIQWKALDEGTDYSSPTNFAKKWEGQHQVSEASSCYSTMSLQKDNTIAFVYEENGGNGGYDIQYKNYTIECLTDGKYSFDAEYVPVIEMQPIQPLSFSPAAGTVEQLDVIEVTFNNDIKLQKGVADLGNGITARLKTHTDNKKLLTVTLDEPITAPGSYTLTFPEKLLKDNDGQVSDEFSVSYRILAEEKPLGNPITSLDEVDNHMVYALYNPHFTAYAIYAPEYNESAVWTANMIGDAGHALSNPVYGETCNFADPNTAWMLVDHNDQYYLYNIGAQKFVKVARPTAFVDEATPIKVLELGNGFAFNTSGGAQDYMCAAPQLTEPIAVWTSSDDGSCWQLVENPNVEDDYVNCMKLIDPSVLVGIESIDNVTAPRGIYDILGRRYEALPQRRGFYIVGGRKVVR
ncbi:MAG: GDSL-type esterase/lipase family protein [Bacteroidales bacterium]|nr:GDSL-type esterase/lipase family protein [Bacteroidales bacterium]